MIKSFSQANDGDTGIVTGFNDTASADPATPAIRSGLLSMIDERLAQSTRIVDTNAEERLHIDRATDHRTVRLAAARDAASATQTTLDNSFLYTNAPILGRVGGVLCGAFAGAAGMAAAPIIAVIGILKGMEEEPLMAVGMIGALPLLAGGAALAYSAAPVWMPIAMIAGAIGGGGYGGIKGPQMLSAFIKDRIAPDHDSNVAQVKIAESRIAALNERRQELNAAQPAIDTAHDHSQKLQTIRDKVKNAFAMPFLSPEDAQIVMGSPASPDVTAMTNLFETARQHEEYRQTRQYTPSPSI